MKQVERVLATDDTFLAEDVERFVAEKTEEYRETGVTPAPAADAADTLLWRSYRAAKTLAASTAPRTHALLWPRLSRTFPSGRGLSRRGSPYATCSP